MANVDDPMERVVYFFFVMTDGSGAAVVVVFNHNVPVRFVNQLIVNG